MVQTVGERFNFNFFFVLPVLLLERGGWAQHAVGKPAHSDRFGRNIWAIFRQASQKSGIGQNGFPTARRENIPNLKRCRPLALPIQKSTGASVFRVTSGPGQAYLLGLLAKIKCSICSYQLNLWYLLHGNK